MLHPTAPGPDSALAPPSLLGTRLGRVLDCTTQENQAVDDVVQNLFIDGTLSHFVTSLVKSAEISQFKVQFVTI